MKILQSIPKHWNLTPAELKTIYDLEVIQAHKLNTAIPEERKKLYTKLYDEYFAALPFHPQFKVKHDDSFKTEKINYLLKATVPFLMNNNTFVEIGAGDCSLSKAIAQKGFNTFALDVSETISKSIENEKSNNNFNFICFDGFNLPFEANSIDVFFSNQLLEHLHPDDVLEQTRNINSCLKSNGKYICITPNKLTGPHDISRFFTNKNVGFHLKEYSAYNLHSLFRKSNFNKIKFYSMILGKYYKIPSCMLFSFEFLARIIPLNMRRIILNKTILNRLTNYICIAFKK
ncbi:MAG: class I SAM-dependent methyltransferase [Bacteroidales bacterium]|nr:class I SAM-dependent methyltransferase [Bacteroidales bacterium]